jgi:GNAT superfamily N-acetyltransferase
MSTTKKELDVTLHSREKGGKSGFVRRATLSDIQIIEAWLPRDPAIESMAVNWKITLKVFQRDGMWVWEDGTTSEPVAYFWGSLTSTNSVLEVRPEFRRCGIGRAFMQFLIDEIKGPGEELLEIECAPPSSKAFWSAMGFEIMLDGRRLIGRRTICPPRV